jgi:hypothetical protein
MDEDEREDKMNKKIAEILEDRSRVENKISNYISAEMQDFFNRNGFKIDNIDISIYDNRCDISLITQLLNEVAHLHKRLDAYTDELRTKFPQYLDRDE